MKDFRTSVEWAASCDDISFLFFLKILFIFKEREREGEGEGEKHQCVVASHTPPTRELAHNPGTCHNWESNLWFTGQCSIH